MESKDLIIISNLVHIFVICLLSLDNSLFSTISLRVGEYKLMTSVGAEVVTRETFEVATGFLVDNWGPQALVDALDLAVLLGCAIASLLTVALLATVLVVKAVLGGLAVLLLLAVGLLVAVGLFAGILVLVLVVLVLPVVRHFAIFGADVAARVNVAVVTVGVIVVAVVAVGVSSDAAQTLVALLGAVMSRSIRIIRAVALLFAVVITSAISCLLSVAFFATVALFFQILIRSSIASITSIAFVVTIASL